MEGRGYLASRNVARFSFGRRSDGESVLPEQSRKCLLKRKA